MSSPEIDERHMRLALAEARKGWIAARPNPMVGAVIVDGKGEVVATGYHARVGTAHAEVMALQRAGERAQGCDVYVSLEPCSHFGRTPPCADALIRAGVRRVFCGMIDPNPLVQGRGVARLREAGIEVVTGVLESECRALNEDFLVYIAERRPFVTVKVAMSADGRIAAHTGLSQWITGQASRADAHALREESDWILTGVGTVLADNPALTARRDGALRPRSPRRAVLDSTLRTPPSARMLHDGGPPVRVFCRDDAPLERECALVDVGVEVRRIAASDRGVDLRDVLRALHADGALRVMVEAGSAMVGSFFDERVVDRLVVYVAPLVLGGPAAYPVVAGVGAASPEAALRARAMRCEPIGDDLRWTLDFRDP